MRENRLRGQRALEIADGGFWGEGQHNAPQKPALINKAFRKANAGQTFPDRSQHFIYEAN